MTTLFGQENPNLNVLILRSNCFGQQRDLARAELVQIGART